MIKRLLRWLLCPAPCKWSVIERVSVYGADSKTVPIGRIFVMRCQACGALRQEKLKV